MNDIQIRSRLQYINIIDIIVNPTDIDEYRFLYMIQQQSTSCNYEQWITTNI
jgi:hypothetical protein